MTSRDPDSFFLFLFLFFAIWQKEIFLCLHIRAHVTLVQGDQMMEQKVPKCEPKMLIQFPALAIYAQI